MLLLLFSFSASACSAFVTIKPLEQTKGAGGVVAGAAAGGVDSGVPGSSFRTSKGFDAVAYVDSIWDSKVVPTVLEKATDLSTVLSAVEANPEAACIKYGHKELGAPYNFIVKTEGQVVEVDTKSRNGLIVLKVPAYTGARPIKVQVGPVIRGTSIRDGIGFIHFSDFLNQIEHADVANELNERMLKVALKGIDPAALQGKTVSVYGVFSMGDDPNQIIIPDQYIITPVKFEVK